MTSPQGPSDGAEQRRFARVPINLDGLIAIGSRAPVSCTVRDFCPGGMFIGADPSAYSSVEPKTPAVLYFALMVDGERQDYQLKLEIARAVAKGIGVSFIEPDAKAVEMLGHLAAPPPPPPLESLSAEARTAAAATQGDADREFAKVIEPLTALVHEQTARLVERFLERVDDALFLAARDAGNNADETRFLDGQRELRRRQPRVREEVVPKIGLALAALGKPPSPLDKTADAIGLSDLSLVDKDDFEEFLVISEMVSELEPQFHEELYALGRRFSALANREVPISAIPIGPGTLCNAIADALKGLQSDRRVIARIYKILHEVMSGNLGRFYADTNQFLIERGVLAVIERDKPPARKRPTTGAGFDAKVPDAAPESPTGMPEPDLTNLMPGPEQYHARPQAPSWVPQQRHPGAIAPAQPTYPPSYAPAQPAYPPSYAPAQPTYPPGYAPAQPGYPPGYAPAGGGQGPATVQAVPPVFPGGPPGASSVPNVGYAPVSVQSMAPVLPQDFPLAGGPASSFVQSAPPTLPAGVMPGGAVHATAPAMPGMVAGVDGDGVMAAAALSGGTMPYYQLPPGWAATTFNEAQPSIQRAYTTAQSQIALRRQLLPDFGLPLSETIRRRGAYSPAQVLEGLSEMQQAYASTASPLLLNPDNVKQRITAALVGDGAPAKLVGDEAGDAIEVVAGLFNALLNDALVANSAKSHLTRLQPSVHKAAVIDAEFFASTDHPVRQLMNRIAEVRDGKGVEFQRRNSRIQELVSQANLTFRDDIGVFNPMVTEMDQILEEQEEEYARRVAEVVESCEQQQRVLEQRRDSSMEATDSQLEKPDLPEEWNKWLERSRKLAVGQQALMNANSATATVVTLIWKETRNKLFVFVDNQGNKASTLTLQQVAMYLRRGIIRTLEHERDEPPLARAMFEVVDQLHGQVEAHATRDELTGFLTRKYFLEAVDASLPLSDTSVSRSTALGQLSLENLKQVNDDYGVATGDALLKACAEALTRALRGKDLIFGRLGGAELGVYWPSGGIQGAYKKVQAALEILSAVAVGADDLDDSVEITMSELETSEVATISHRVAAEFVIGLSGSDDGLIQAEGLLGAAREACDSARMMGLGSIYVAGNETQQRRQMEQMVVYVNKALDRGRLILSAQSVTSLRDIDVPPALHVAVSARDRADKAIPIQLFAPALARSDKGAEVDQWVLRQTLAWMVANEEQVERYAVVIVPLTAASMKNEDLPGEIMGLFMETAVPPGKICFEIPDRDVVENVVEAGELISTLKEFGCRFVLDEFGSGHANYDYIKELAVDYVSIKSSFIADAHRNPKDFAMAKSINELAHFMGKKTIAKQDAGLDMAATMREIGVDFLYDLAEQTLLSS